jgi:hypothetical protein
MVKHKRTLDELPTEVLALVVEDFLPDPKDAAVLRSVSKRMSTAVDETGRNLKHERDLFFF